MNKRLQKRHKRQVSRAKEQGRTSEPDVRTAEQIRAAREASQPAGGWRDAAHGHRGPASSQTVATPGRNAPSGDS